MTKSKSDRPSARKTSPEMIKPSSPRDNRRDARSSSSLVLSFDSCSRYTHLEHNNISSSEGRRYCHNECVEAAVIQRSYGNYSQRCPSVQRATGVARPSFGFARRWNLQSLMVFPNTIHRQMIPCFRRGN